MSIACCHILCCCPAVARVFFTQSLYSVRESIGSLLVTVKTSKLHSEAFDVIVTATNGSAKREQSMNFIRSRTMKRVYKAAVCNAATSLNIKPL